MKQRVERTLDMIRVEKDISCPFCKSENVETNGNGYFRCKGECKSEFFVCKYENKWVKG